MSQEYTFKDENAEASGKQIRTLGIAIAKQGIGDATITRSMISGLINSVKRSLGETVDSSFKIQNPELSATKKQFFLLGKLSAQLQKITSKKEVSEAISNAFSKATE